MNVVTGAFGYIGRAITQYLLEQGEQVRTITTHPDKPNPFGASVEALPYNFDHPDELRWSTGLLPNHKGRTSTRPNISGT